AIVMIENAHKHLERDRGKKPHWEIISDSAKEVGPALFFSLLIITFSFIPVFALSGQSGRMFKPLAFTKTYSMAAAALLSVTIVPILMGFLIRGRIVSEARHPISRALIWAYRPVLRLALHWRWAVIIIAVVGLAATWYPYSHLGSEFIPPLNEGDLLYMPSLLPGISIGQVRDILQRSDRILYQFPEVESVFGKAGRAESALDPAPLTMIETVIRLKPREEWRPGLTTESLIAEMNAALDFPGVTNAFTMPIKTRIDMLSTGIKTPVGIKLLGADLQVLQELGSKVEAIVSTIPGTRSVYAERVVGGNYVDVKIDRAAAARYGLTVGAIENVIETAIGGRRVTTTVEGLERYPVNVRYARELRSDLPSLRRTLISTPTGTQVPLEQVADLSLRKGPPSIKTEGAQPTAWIYVDIDDDQDVGSYVDRAKEMLDQSFELPTGYSLVWSGQYEYMLEARARLRIAVPLTLIVILLLLYMNFGNISESLIVILTVPFAVIGGVWLIYFLGYNISVGVMVGFIALAGVAAEIGVVMIIYLDHEYKAKREELGAGMTRENLRETVVAGAVERVRPVMMTVTAIMAGLLPIMWGNETGASVMKRIAAPMIGGMATATALSLLLIPIVYEMWRGRAIEHQAKLRAKNH
ncbi:MAG TPA: efflux RND transporter permease subunit, partial [Acidobacteria bacterium]|nr:efflux RND transporter permease subunit [Acidobacteriota bacterium]